MSKEILVVDDEIGIRELLSEILMDEGYDVTLAENAAAAREYRFHKRPDLVLLDIWMPEMDGISLLKEWMNSGQLTMPVVMMSGHGTIDTAVEAIRIGAIGFLEKPIALKKLLDSVAQGLLHPVPQLSGSAQDKPVLPHALAADAHVSANKEAAALPDSPSSADLGFTLDLPLREARDIFERHYFERLIVQTDGNMTRVAEYAGVERTHLYRKLKQLGVELNKKQSS
ncbi:MAG TPA: response regulator [Burkholderiales bacterium]|nr:response regulator [Burkholderiales bacterium]